MFITIEDETGPANLVVWPSLFEKRRRVVLGSSMMAINGKIQREGEVVHLVAQQVFDLSDLSGLADRDMEFKLPTGRATSSRMAAGWTQGTSRSLRFSHATSSSRISISTC
ncbi:DNA polymerase III alpha subunit [Rhizobium mongolense]|uniref:DNA polymerase III alpha subunit n=1 Tax=Rhizobium mongolense TaxID=57676 RepID=A0A7W6RHD8_9HYPH|nr:DNA polymerase III alpha subunit [Rhizobium mongolense]